MLANDNNMLFSFWSCFGVVSVLVVVYLLYTYCSKKYIEYKANTENKFELDKSEYPEGIDYRTTDFFQNKNDVKYVFWSGGYSSTFRLCQLLLIEERPVQPIYIHTHNFGSYEKKNEMEILKMKDIRRQLLKDYPILKTRLAPTMYVTSIKKDPAITKKFKNLHFDFGFFEFNEQQDKYENIARFTNNYENLVDLPIDKDEYHLHSVIKPYLESDLNNYQKLGINIPVKFQDIHIFDNCRYPILHLKKDDIKMIAIKNHFYYILKMTWSCNNPTVNGGACLECPNCMSRNI